MWTSRSKSVTRPTRSGDSISHTSQRGRFGRTLQSAFSLPAQLYGSGSNPDPCAGHMMGGLSDQYPPLALVVSAPDWTFGRRSRRPRALLPFKVSATFHPSGSTGGRSEERCCEPDSYYGEPGRPTSHEVGPDSRGAREAACPASCIESGGLLLQARKGTDGC